MFYVMRFKTYAVLICVACLVAIVFLVAVFMAPGRVAHPYKVIRQGSDVVRVSYANRSSWFLTCGGVGVHVYDSNGTHMQEIVGASPEWCADAVFDSADGIIGVGAHHASTPVGARVQVYEIQEQIPYWTRGAVRKYSFEGYGELYGVAAAKHNPYCVLQHGRGVVVTSMGNEGESQIPGAGVVDTYTITADGNHIITVEQGVNVRKWDVPTGKKLVLAS